MSVAPTLDLRRAIVTHLRADTAVITTAIGTRIYGEKSPANPEWPFARYGVSDAVPGFEISAPIHIFSKAEFTDDVATIAEAIGNSLDGKVLTLGDGRKVHLAWAGQRVVSGEDEWHVIVTIGARVPREC